MQHPWTWAVVYDDGQACTEEEAGGFGNLPLEQVRAVVLTHVETGAQYVIQVPPDARPIFFRRKRQLLDAHTGTSNPPTLFATVCGWQKTVRGRNTKTLLWLLYDGSVLLTDRDLDDLG